MVIGQQFVWGHLGKTGGDATLHLFRFFPELIVSADDAGTNAKHRAFTDSLEAIRGKVLALNIRRLPSWILSFAHHRAKCGLYPDYKSLPLMTTEEMTKCTEPDQLLSIFTGNGRLRIDRWLRMEYLKSDFLGFISEFTKVTPTQRMSVMQTGLINASDYEHKLGHWFNAEQLKLMYASNPIWAEIEQRVYPADAPPSLLGFKSECHPKDEAAEHFRRVVAAYVPEDSHVLVVSKGDESLCALEGCRAAHFPQDSAGAYAGHHPANSEAAIKELDRLKSSGVQYLIFPSAAFWWLDHYDGLRRHLEGKAKRVCSTDVCIIYRF